MTINVPPELEEFVRRAVASGAFKNPDEVIRKALELLRRERATISPAASPRQGGQWRGRVKVANDFDELPDDLQESFGMRER